MVVQREPGPTPLGSSAMISASAPVKIVNIAGGIAATTGSAGVGLALLVEIIDQDTRAYLGNNVTLRVHGNVGVTTDAGMNYFGLAVSLGGSTSAGVSGSFGILLLGQSILPDTDDGTRASIGDPTAVEATAGTITVSASAPNSYSLIAGNVGIGSSAGVGVSAAIFVISGNVTTTRSPRAPARRRSARRRART